MYRPQSSIDRRLTNGVYVPPEHRDYNAVQTGTRPGWHVEVKKPKK